MKQASFTGTSKIIVADDGNGKTSTHISTEFNLEVSKNQDKNMFLDFKGRPREKGIKPLTQAFVQGLVGNIHFAHERGWWDSAAHLRYIIDELTRGFAEVAKVQEGNFTED